ncbi:MAG: DNA-binding response regulator [Bacteroidetes bacterium]|nr:MAG: DNA-binding response regulator [Bacteroidota bacterium]
MNKKVLIIEDDAKIVNLLNQYLSGFGYKVIFSLEPLSGIEMVFADKPDLVILDIMLPNIDGFETCRRIRKKSRVPIIMLTARGDVNDRIVGLELGADDYLPKPFEPRELVARMETILRRVNEVDRTPVIKVGRLEIDTDRYTVFIEGEQVDLTTKEFELLVLFAKNKGRVLSRDQIMEGLSGMDWEAFDRSIDVSISRLRKKLKNADNSATYIKTVWGAGYKFTGNG